MRSPTDCRHWRKIKPVLRDSVPEWNAYLATVTRVTESADRPGTGRIEPVRAGIRVVRHRGIHSSRPHDIQVELAPAVWAGLHLLFPKRGVTWLWSLDLARDLTLTSWWRQHETGNFRLAKPVRHMMPPHGGNGDEPNDRHGFVVLQNPPSVIVGWLSGRKVCLVDVRNYLNTDLRTLCEWVAGGRGAFLYAGATGGNMERAIDAQLEILERASLLVMDTVREIEGGQLRPTAASQGWEAWRRRLTVDVPVVHGNADALGLEREGFFGGLVEARFVGAYPGTAYRVDVQSLYPSVMAKERFPVTLSCYRGCGVSPDSLSGEDGMDHIARVVINSEDSAYPVRMKYGVVYAKGRFTTALCGDALRAAIRRGHVTDIGATATYKMGRPFTDFVKAWWDARHRAKVTGRNGQAALIKSVMNGLYGKMGQKGMRWIPDPKAPARRPWGHWYRYDDDRGTLTEYRALGDDVQCRPVFCRLGKVPSEIDAGRIQPVRIADFEAPLSMPSVAAYVTMYARDTIAGLIMLAGPRTVLMVQTDALWVTQEGLDNLQRRGQILDGTLGMLRIVDSSDGVTIKSPWDYTYGGVETISGVPFDRSAVAEHRYKARLTQGVESVLSTGQCGYLTWRDAILSTPTATVPGTVAPDGWVSLPVVNTV